MLKVKIENKTNLFQLKKINFFKRLNSKTKKCPKNYFGGEGL